MDCLLYMIARLLVSALQALSLRMVAKLGRAGGAVACRIDGRHRRVAERNLAAAFPEKTPAEVSALVRENFRRIGENFACAVKTACMSEEEIRSILTICGAERFLNAAGERRTLVFAIGHFGNFELHARCRVFLPGFRCATTYRGLRQASLNRLLQDLRQKSGCLFFERRTDAEALKAAMNQGNIILGLLADQHAGDKGLRLPFFGRDCSTSAAPALFALRYRASLFTAICYRVELGRWQVEVGPEIPTHQDGQPRSIAEIMLDVNRALEAAVRRDPANWFWVHNRWKPGKWRERPAQSSENVAVHGPMTGK